MTDRDVAMNHLNLASEIVESTKSTQAGTTFLQKVTFSLALALTRAIVHALLSISSEIKFK